MRAMRILAAEAAEEDHRPASPSIDAGGRSDSLRAGLATSPGRAGSACRIARPRSLWSEIEDQAIEMAAREPMLRQAIDETGFTARRPGSSARYSRAGWRGPAAPVAIVRRLVLDALGEDPTVLEFLETDLRAVVAHDPACRSGLHALLHLKGFHALQTHRVAHSLWKRGREDIAHWLASQASATLGVDIHPAVPIGAGVMLDHGTGIVIGETAVVEDGVTILQGVTLGATGKHARRPPSQGPARRPARGRREGARQHRDRPHEPGRRGQRRAPLRARLRTVAGVAARVVRTRDADGIEIAVEGDPNEDDRPHRRHELGIDRPLLPDHQS